MNKDAARVNAFIKGVEGIVAPIVEAAVIAAVPGLGAPIVKQIVAAVEHALEDQLAKYAQLGATFVIIDTQTANQNTRMGRAEKALEDAILSGDQARIDAAQKEYDDANSALVNFDGGARPS